MYEYMQFSRCGVAENELRFSLSASLTELTPHH